jgi:hypothetical protein
MNLKLSGRGHSARTTKIYSIRGILNNTFKPNLVQKFSRIKVHNALDFPLFYMKGKFGIIEYKVFQKSSRGTPLLTTEGMKKFWKT